MSQKFKIHDANELVQYYIVNKDLEMSKGKVAGQVAHCATMITLKEHETDKFKEWYSNSQKKIILQAHEKDLLKLIDKGFYYIRDNGLTEIKEGSLTCVALGIMTRKEADQYVKRLQLCK